MTTVLQPVNLGVRFPRETLDKLDKYKGYHSRNKYLLKIVDEHISRLERVEEASGVADKK
jgi:hypothetical protein